MSSKSPEVSLNSEENETHGPKAGVKITLEQADLIIRRHFPGLHASTLSHIDRGYNNRVYIVTTTGSSSSENSHPSEVILRLSGRFWTRYKTENEVAALLQMSQMECVPVPKVFGYCTDKEKSGINAEYILMEKAAGEPLEYIWRGALDSKGKMCVLDQLTKMFANIQKIRFPKIGSFQFPPDPIGNSEGLGIVPCKDIPDPRAVINIEKGVEYDGGPFQTFLEYFRSTCETEIEYLRKTPFMKSSDGYERRLQRVEQFVKAFENLDTVPAGIDKAALVEVPFVFTHGDLEPRNILVDKESLQITSILDFEFSGSCPIDEEWFTGYRFVDSDTSDWKVFQNVPNLYNEKDKGPKPGNSPEIKDYFLRKMRENGAVVPDDMLQQHMVRAELYYFKGFICPWWLREEIDPIPESHYSERKNACVNVDGILNKYGF